LSSPNRANPADSASNAHRAQHTAFAASGADADADAYAGADAGLLAPVWAGSAGEACTGDEAVLQAMLDAEAALARAQAGLGLAPREAADAITAAARADRFDVRALAVRARAGGNPVIPLAAELRAAVGRDAGAYVHRGATSQDVLDTALMLVASRALDTLLPELARTARALAVLAAEHRDTPLPGRTLTQHAVPTAFGLKAAGWRALVLDAWDRVAAVRDGLPVQLGGAAGTLAAFGAYAEAQGDADSAAAQGERESAQAQDGGPGAAEGTGLRLLRAYARELALAEPLLPWHTLRTPVADLGSALGFACGALGKCAADVLVLSRTEVGEVAEGEGGGSSAMPHKANPVRATLLTAAARQAPPLTATLLASLAAEDERPGGAWHAEWQPLRELLRLACGAAHTAAELAEGLRVFPHRMHEHLAATEGLIVSERVAAALEPLLGRERARELLTSASRSAASEGVPLDEALREQEPELDALLPRERLRELTDPARYIGAAPALTDRALRRPGPGSGSGSRSGAQRGR